MQQWEYAFLESLEDYRLLLRTPGEQIIRDAAWWDMWWKELGDEGWELAAASGRS